MAELELIGFPQSTFVRVCRIVCEEKRVAYKLTSGSPHTPAVNAISPWGRIPAMVHGKTQLFESQAIVTYIDRKFPGRKVIPASAAGGAEVMQWVSFANTVVDVTMIRKYVLAYMFPPKPGKPDRKRINAAVPDLERQFKILNKAVTKTGMLVGKSYSYADINLMPVINYTRMFPEGEEALNKARKLKAWFEKNAKRRSWKASAPPAK